MDTTIKIKPLSVNEAWKGKRFKTDKYSMYEKILLILLPKISIPSPPYKVFYEFGLSNIQSDWDNPIKSFQDVLQKKYGINDKHIFEANVKKTIVKKGDEFIKFRIDRMEL